MARDRRFRSRRRREGNAGQFSRRGPRSAGLQTGIARAAGETPIAPREEARGRLGAPTSSRHRQPEAGGTRIALHRRMLRRPIPELTQARPTDSEIAKAPPPQRGAPIRRPRHSVELRGPSVEFPPADPATAWSCPQQIPLQRGARRLQRGADPSRSRFSVELTGSSVEFLPVNPATAWSCAAPAWSSRQQTPLQRGARRLQRGVAPSRSRFSVGLDGSSVELTPADPASAWSWAPSAWSWAPSAWSCGRQIQLQRGADRLQRGVPANRSRFSVGLDGSSVELTPADPASAWSSAASAWSSPRQIPLQRGARRPQRGARPGRSRFSVELTGSSVELPPADPATAWSSAASAWSCPQQIPLLRGAARLQRGVRASRPRYSVELRGFSVEFPPADPATAWSSAASAWSSRQQIPLQRGAGRLQRGADPGRSRFSVELGAFSVELAPADPATAWS